MRALIVDDDPEFRALAAEVAAEIGWQVGSAGDADGFKEEFLKGSAALIVLDLQLGTADGIELLRYLGGEKYVGRIFLVSGVDTRLLQVAQQLGSSLGLEIVAALRKPLRMAEFRAALELQLQQMRPLLQDTIAAGLASGEFSLAFQPIVDAQTLQPVKLEALARWRHPHRGSVSPGTFIPILETDSALMDRFTLWVVREALRHRDAFRFKDAVLPVSINVSGVNLDDLTLPERMAAATEEMGASPDAIELEITESAATSDPMATLEILARLRLKGFGLGLDDFGTGYSSLVALHRLPFTHIKVDRSFVRELPGQREAGAIIKTVAALAQNLGLTSVAEGVETDAQVEALRALGVDCLQGYRICRPKPLRELVDWLAEIDGS